jgi:hypothetical protein
MADMTQPVEFNFIFQTIGVIITLWVVGALLVKKSEVKK